MSLSSLCNNNTAHSIDCAKPEWTPKFSQQTYTQHTCGIHVIAMITHLPYEYITTVLPKFKGTNHKELCETLYMLGYDADFEWTKYTGQTLPELCILHVRNHWCVYFKGQIWCSHGDVRWTVKEYGRVKHFIRVTVPNG